ncbi:hypothetical protein MARI151_10747 [Maribacter litoralis]|uniref:Uncharacterized protein n=1 Tax=Maribacter litoralis TaxID=2059726 RepID=A0A653NN76_9FLAO|nr:hypothetical protein MARI151_10747 [Maribacter litoralis]
MNYSTYHHFPKVLFKTILFDQIKRLTFKASLILQAVLFEIFKIIFNYKIIS